MISERGGGQMTVTLLPEMSWGPGGTWRRVGKWIPAAVDSATGILKGSGWTVDNSDPKGRTARVRASVHVDSVRFAMDKFANSVERASEHFRFV